MALIRGSSFGSGSSTCLAEAVEWFRWGFKWGFKGLGFRGGFKWGFGELLLGSFSVFYRVLAGFTMGSDKGSGRFGLAFYVSILKGHEGCRRESSDGLQTTNPGRPQNASDSA